jgi:AhpD family alkylhydroperoxidase
MDLENRILALIAVGASVSANCQPCLERNIKTALKCGADPQQISQAIEIGKRVRHGAASKMDDFILRLEDAAEPHPLGSDGGCGCGL